jgi:hypothetical protein
MFRGFLKTASVSAAGFISAFGFLEGGRSVLRGAWEAFKASLHRESDLSRARMASCRGCEMMDEEYQSCGNPREFYVDAKGTNKSLGCHCFLPLATKLPSHNCWARFHKLEFGWPDALCPNKT